MVALTKQEVVLSVRADDKGNKRRVRLAGEEFIRRFMLHVLPAGIKRIRHYGLLASACKTIRLAQARQALQMPAAQAQAIESAADFMRRVAGIEASQCPRCKVGHLMGGADGGADIGRTGETAHAPRIGAPECVPGTAVSYSYNFEKRTAHAARQCLSVPGRRRCGRYAAPVVAVRAARVTTPLKFGISRRRQVPRTHHTCKYAAICATICNTGPVTKTIPLSQ